METTQNNRLIAEFMELPTEIFSSGRLNYGINEAWYELEELSFNTDWNWLMEVVEKIEKLDYSLNMQYLSCQGYIVSNKGYNAIDNHVEIATVSSVPNRYVSSPPTAENPMFVSEFNCPKEALYNLVLRFINWYNEKK